MLTLIRRCIPLLDRYILSEFIGPFLLAVMGFVIIGIVDILFTLVDLFINLGIPFLIVVRLLIYRIPAIMVIFFPMAVIFSVMLLLVRMAKDNEITILRASGLNVIRLTLPLLVIVLLVCLGSYITNEKIVPIASNLSETLFQKSVQKKAPPTVAKNVFFKEEGDRFFFIRRIDAKKSKMYDILIFEQTPEFPRIITAKTARWNKKTWTLMDGKIHEFDSNGDLTFATAFRQTQIHVERDIRSFYARTKTAREMDSAELKEKITVLDKGGVNTIALKVEYHMKKSLPMACLIFGIIGTAFCLHFVRSGKDWWGVITAIIIAVLLVGFYFFTVALFRSLAKKGVILPVLGAWLPNMLYGIPGIGIIVYDCYQR